MCLQNRQECPVICFNLVTCNCLHYVIIKNTKDYLQNKIGLVMKNENIAGIMREA